MACPICGSDRFYVKDPEDEYDTFEFTLVDGNPVFDQGWPDFISPDDREFQAYCDTCIWHGKFQELNK